jgi:FkbM family methyltransferase
MTVEITYDSALIYDVGMHLGEDTEYYLKKGFRVIAFEANPRLVSLCKRKFVDQIASDQLTIVEGAIAPKHYGNRITFYMNCLSEWGTIETAWNELNVKRGTSSKIIEVGKVDFYSILKRYGVPFFLKIDIEGADQYVLNALAEFFPRPKYISMESKKVEFRQLQDELKVLCELGYNKFRAVQQKTIPGSSIITRDIYGIGLEHTFPAHASGPFGDDLLQPWLSYEQVLKTYRRIFLKYRLFGDTSILRYHMKGGGRLLSAAEWLTRRPLPGWYDTHACQ